MRRDLEVWPSGGRPRRPCRAGDARDAEPGVTRRGFLVGAGFAAALVVVGGIAWRVAPWRDWLGAAGDTLGVDIPGASSETVQDFIPPLALRGQAGRLQHRLAARDGAGRPAPRLFRAAGPQRRPADGVRGPCRGGGARGRVAAVRRRRHLRRRDLLAPPQSPARTIWASLLHELIPTCARRFKLGGGGRKRAIIGWSMGAYGALVAAETDPDLFAAVVAVSPAVWTSYDAMMLGPRDAFDDAADFARYDVIAHADRLAGRGPAHRLRQARPVLRLRHLPRRPPSRSLPRAGTAGAATTTSSRPGWRPPKRGSSAGAPRRLPRAAAASEVTSGP